MQNDWLSLRDTAGILGVHPGTVRNWSNKGLLPVHRTRGGHRRYLRSEIELWMLSRNPGSADEANLVVQNALLATRFQISLGRLEQEGWYVKLNNDAREQYRQSGRALLQGLINHLNSQDDGAGIEAELLGYEYALHGRQFGLSSVEAVYAFLFFRNTLFDSLLGVYEAAAVCSSYAWSDMFRKVNEFTDMILVTLLETYHAYKRASQSKERKKSRKIKVESHRF